MTQKYTITDMIYNHIIVMTPLNPGQVGYTGYFQEFPNITASGEWLEDTKANLLLALIAEKVKGTEIFKERNEEAREYLRNVKKSEL